jgi:NAD(P)-dependent dehydrogenase (short-subunit alcohol dehydrogenase family)
LERFNIAGRTAVITGAASGLGRAFTLALGESGAKLVCLDRDAEGLEQTRSLAHSRSMDLLCILADVANVEEVEAAVQCIAEHAPGVDILVNNAGIATLPARTHEVSLSDWDRVVACNLRSMFLVTRAILPSMLKRRSGSIVNLSSFLGLVGLYPGFPITAIPYASTKAGVVGFTRQLAIEYAGDGIRANAIAPGWHGGTNLARERRAVDTTEERRRFEEFIASSVPMGRRGSPEDLCGLLLYLASDASLYVTGQVFAHDGGLTAA